VTFIKNEITLELEKICKCIYFPGSRKDFKSCKLNRTSSVVTVCRESDMEDNGVPQSLSDHVSIPHSQSYGQCRYK